MPSGAQAYVRVRAPRLTYAVHALRISVPSTLLVLHIQGDNLRAERLRNGEDFRKGAQKQSQPGNRQRAMSKFGVVTPTLFLAAAAAANSP